MKVNGEGRGRGERWGEEGGGEGIEGAFVRRIYEEKVGGLGEAGGKGEGGLVDKTWQLLFDHRLFVLFLGVDLFFGILFSFSFSFSSGMRKQHFLKLVYIFVSRFHFMDVMNSFPLTSIL